ncbi:MAG TPA: ribose-phosphate pyrophosphokinase-like domain-containing protein [Candidatus Binataceae bacterium]|nr:ribose-phosphate pyrophosphokinase-like domain-containing protein [Candidatus Binataceae bacterium]
MSLRSARVDYGADDARLGHRLAALANLVCAKIRVHRFPDGEVLPRIAPPAATEAILVWSLDGAGASLIEALLAADALRRAGARRVTLVAPYLPYMRQDKVFRPGEPISQRVIGAMLGSAFDRVVTIEPHLHRISRLGEVFRCRADSRADRRSGAARWLPRSRARARLGGCAQEVRRDCHRPALARVGARGPI